ncbi:MAG: hypothetical protein R3B70_01735 [Polyangiaceae bacterium]
METLSHEARARLLPGRPEGDEEALRRALAALRYTPEGAPTAHFELSAPLGWQWQPRAESPPVPGLLVSLAEPGGRGRVLVSMDEVPRELSPADWALMRLEERGHTLLASKSEYTPLGAVADLLTRASPPSGPVLARTNMAKAGRRIFLVTCEAPEDEYPRWAPLFYIALATFRALHRGDAALAEPLDKYLHIHPAVVGFSYPASLQLIEDIRSRDEHALRLVDPAAPGEDTALHPTLTLRSLAGARPRRLATEHIERARKSGARFDDLPDLAPLPPPDLFEAASGLDLTGSSPSGDIALRLAVFESEAGAVLLACDGPARARAPFGWAVGRRAFEIVRDTLFLV